MALGYVYRREFTVGLDLVLGALEYARRAIEPDSGTKTLSAIDFS